MIDVNTFIGPYPFRHVPHPEAEILDRVVQREGLDGAWVGHLPSAWHRDPSLGNAELFETLERVGTGRLFPVPTIRPDWPAWEKSLRAVTATAAVGIRAYPMHWGFGPDDRRMVELAIAAGEQQLPVILTVKFEDLRQRNSLDTTSDLTAAHIRHLARAGDRVRLIVTAAGREMIEEVHWGLTATEQERVFWDISWIWGPPEDHLAKLFKTVGPERFVYGTQWPMRLTQTPRANLDLLPEDFSDPELADPRRMF
jgi:predicted TIM-barrel fold metal-dependent hydrolase